MTPATTPGAGLPRPPGQPGEVPGGGAARDGAPRAAALRPAAARALLVAGAVVAALAAAAYLTALATHPWKSLLNGFDLQVYLGGAQQALHHAANLYSWHYRHDLGIQFTYTPFAALLFAAGLAVPFQALMGLVSVAGTFGLAATVWIALRELGWRSMPARAGATLLVTGLAFWTEPVQRALYLGQVELVMMAVIVWDMCQPDRRRWKGAALGVAAGIKLVPLLFIAYLLVTRRFRQAYVACAAFGATVVIGFAALPRPSVSWWLKLNFLEASRTGFVGGQQNQSLRGIVTRLAGSVAAGQLPWLAGAIVVALAGLGAAVVLGASRAARAGWLGLAGLVLAIYGAWPDFWRPTASLLQGGLINYAPAAVFAHGDSPAYPEYHWTGLQSLAGNLYLLGGFALFAVALVAAARQLRAAGGTALLRGPVPTSEMPASLPEILIVIRWVSERRCAARPRRRSSTGRAGTPRGSALPPGPARPPARTARRPRRAAVSRPAPPSAPARTTPGR